MILDPNIVRDVLLFLEDNLIYEDFDTQNPHIHNTFSATEIGNYLNKKKHYHLSDDKDIADRLPLLLRYFSATFLQSSRKALFTGDWAIILLPSFTSTSYA